MKLSVINYTGENYRDCLNFTKPSWGKAGGIIIYSDSDKLGIKKYEPMGEDFDGHCKRKILTVKDIIKNHKGQEFVYLDTDVYMRECPKEVFEDNPNADLIVTRMVRRKRFHHPEINAGVFFFRANDRTEKMCDLWLELEAENRAKGNVKYPEQNALEQIAYMGYDHEIDLKVANVSENIYNFERDNRDDLIAGMNNAKLVHFKGLVWKVGKVVNSLRDVL